MAEQQLTNGSDVHVFKTHGILLTRPIPVIEVQLPEGLTDEQIAEIIKEFTDERTSQQ